MKHFLTRLKYLLKGNLFAFKRYDPKGNFGFTEIYYKGMSVVKDSNDPVLTITLIAKKDGGLDRRYKVNRQFLHLKAGDDK